MNHPISGPKNGTPGRWACSKRNKWKATAKSSSPSGSPTDPVNQLQRLQLDGHRLVYGESNWSRQANEIETEISIRKLAGMTTIFVNGGVHTPSPQMAWQQQVNDTIIKWLQNTTPSVDSIQKHSVQATFKMGQPSSFTLQKPRISKQGLSLRDRRWKNTHVALILLKNQAGIQLPGM